MGKALFFLERFKGGNRTVNVVYDCGSGTSVDLVWTRINEVFSPGDEIAAVFISHLDADHVNGLEYLLKRCHVRHLFFPLLTKGAKTLSLLEYLSNSETADRDSFVFHFIENPQMAVGRLFRDSRGFNNDFQPPVLHPVLPYRGDGEEPGPEDVENEGGITVSPIPSGRSVERIISSSFDSWESKRTWLYIPFNFRQEEHCNWLLELLRIEFGASFKPEDLLDICKNDPRALCKLRKAYRQIPGTLNSNSLVLYSGYDGADPFLYSIEKNLLMKYKILFPSCYHEKLIPGGCLYFGDYKAAGSENWSELDNALRPYFKFVGCLQLPHHGSRHNFNQNLLSELKNCTYYFAAAGQCNRYGHPHDLVLHEVLFGGRFPIVITEDSNSEVHFLINLN